MKETLYTIPLTDAFNAHDECPFCFVERDVEQDLLDLVLGSSASYMESDMREMTDKAGFCRSHFQKMFDYGNALGNAWILKTHYLQMQSELDAQIKMFAPGKVSLMNRIKKSDAPDNNISSWIKEKETSCYICNNFKKTYDRYLDTFFFMYKKDGERKRMIENSKGFCMHHFGQLMERAEQELPEKQKQWFVDTVMELMKKNLNRVKEDLDHFVEMFDYRNAGSDWRNSRDAVERTMQKLKGGYPADKPYKTDF